MNSVLLVLQFTERRLESEKVTEALFKLDELFSTIFEDETIANYDGHEFSNDSMTYFFYGKDLDFIHRALIPIIKCLPSLPGSYIDKQYEFDESKNERIVLF